MSLNTGLVVSQGKRKEKVSARRIEGDREQDALWHRVSGSQRGSDVGSDGRTISEWQKSQLSSRRVHCRTNEAKRAIKDACGKRGGDEMASDQTDADGRTHEKGQMEAGQVR